MIRLIKENDSRKEKVANSMQTLLHIVEVNKKSKFIESLELSDVYVSDKYNTIECDIKVMGWCEDPDLGELTKVLKDIDNDIYNIIKDYELDKEGNIKKCPPNDTYLMYIADSVNWNVSDGNIIIGFHIVQDDFRNE